MTELVLGTAQWGAQYGITNARGRISDVELVELVASARRNGIRRVDSAAAYGDAHRRLAPWAGEFRVTTKVAGADPDAVAPAVEQALGVLGVDAVDTVLLHDWDALDLSCRVAAAAALEAVREGGWCTRAGVSIYDEAALRTAGEAFGRLDVAQVPVNALDRRLEGSETVRQLSAAGTSIQARSVFLQGLLIGTTDSSLGSHPDVERFRAEAGSSSSALHLALGHVRAQEWVQEVVVGATSAVELDAIAAAWRDAPSVPAPARLASQDLDVIDPRRWR